MRVRKLHRIEFFARTNIEEVNLFAARNSLRQFARFDLQREVCFVAGDDVLGHFIHVEIFVPRADASQRFIRAESATAATADVILSEQGALRARAGWAILF